MSEHLFSRERDYHIRILQILVDYKLPTTLR